MMFQKSWAFQQLLLVLSKEGDIENTHNTQNCA